MASGLLSLKWNNHRSTFFHVLSTIRSKESYCDVTLACDGRFYALHKFVLSTCSEYFEEMFERTQCKHPVIVLKDIKYDDLEALLNYMYVGEVNVVQEKLAGLIKAAECLKIKGLAVPDEDPMENKENPSLGRDQQHKRSQRNEDSPRAKRRRRETSTDISEEILSPVRNRSSGRNRENQSSNKAFSEEQIQSDNKEENEEMENSSINANRQTDSTNNRTNSSHKKENLPEEVILDDDAVKAEPIDLDNDNCTDNPDNKDALHQELGFDASDSMGGDDDNYVDVDPSMLGGPQSVEDVVAQAMPGSSGFQGNSFPMWEGEGSLSNFPNEGFSGDNAQARQMRGATIAAAAAAHHWTTVVDHHQQATTPPATTTTTIPSNDYFSNSDGAAAAADDGCRNLDSRRLVIFNETPEDGKPYSCSACNYRCKQKSHIMQHVRIHTGEKPYKCTFCDLRSSRQANINKHERQIHMKNLHIGAGAESLFLMEQTPAADL